jgi:predicted membrane metal-binding protein
MVTIDLASVPRVEAPVRKTTSGVVFLFSATLAAELILLPISAAVFARVSVFGLVLNLIAIPAMALVQIAGFIKIGFSGWWNRGAWLAAAVSDAAASLLVGSSTVVDPAGLGAAARPQRRLAGHAAVFR